MLWPRLGASLLASLAAAEAEVLRCSPYGCVHSLRSDVLDGRSSWTSAVLVQHWSSTRADWTREPARCVDQLESVTDYLGHISLRIPLLSSWGSHISSLCTQTGCCR